MAQLRRHPDVFPPYLGSHNMNGNSERVEQREKAKIARIQTTDLETNKKASGPWFPPPIKVDSSDKISKMMVESLGPYNNFVKVLNEPGIHEKTPGQDYIGVMPVPQTPTEKKKQYFPSSSHKTKPKDKPTISTSAQERVKANIVADKPDQKLKFTSDSSRHKQLKLGEKLNEKKDNKDTKVVNKISLEKYKSNQGTVGLCEKANTLPANKHKSSACATDNTTKNNKSEELNSDVEKVVAKEETTEPSHQEPSKMERPKPTPLQLPTRNASSSSLLQSPQHRDMKVQNILKEMTETVNMPLTGIFTPKPKQDSHFPFPINIFEKVNPVVSEPKNSVIDDLDVSDDDNSDDEGENDNDQSKRPAGQTRSRSSSSSSSSSSGESSDSEGEDEEENTHTSTVPKTSMLNAISSPLNALKTPSPVEPTSTSPQNNRLDNLGKLTDVSLHSQASFTSTTDEGMGRSLNSSSKLDDTNFLEKSEDEFSNKDSSGQADEQNDEAKSADKVKLTSPSAGQKLRTKAESKESLPDTKIRIKVEKGSNDTFKVKSESKVKGEVKKKSELENKKSGEVKNNSEKSKTTDKTSDYSSKASSKLGVKLKKNASEVEKVKKLNETKEEKTEVKKKDKKSDEQAVQKKIKRKHKDSTGEPGKNCKDKSDQQASKEKSDISKENSSKEKTETLSAVHRTKSGNKLKKSASDEADEEDSVIDVVGDNSPVAKKKKMGSVNKPNGLNGVHKNGHIDTPLGIQLVHDKEHDPTSLIVKIPLSFLKRLPGRLGEDLTVKSSHTGVELGSHENGGKGGKDWTGKKNGENGENGDMEIEHTEEISHEKKRHLDDQGKRSPSWDSGHSKKRLRRESQHDRSDVEQKKRKTASELNAECEADIRKVEPDAHLQQAKTLKREADKLTDKKAKSRTYVEAIIRFICCGKALEDKEDGEQRAGQMYSETTELLRFILKHVLGKTEDKRLLILCLRVQSLLLHKLYRMKGKQTVRNTQILAEHFKFYQATHKNNITSPYTTGNKHASTPSPMSPTPSPAGSVGSIGSSGSNSSGEGNHNQNGRHATTASVTSPVSVSIPQRIHSVMAQHVSSTSKLVNSIDMWDKADSLTSDYQEFFNTVDSICQPLTFHSSIPHIVNYVKKCLSYLHEHGKETQL